MTTQSSVINRAMREASEAVKAYDACKRNIDRTLTTMKYYFNRNGKMITAASLSNAEDYASSQLLSEILQQGLPSGRLTEAL